MRFFVLGLVVTTNYLFAQDEHSVIKFGAIELEFAEIKSRTENYTVYNDSVVFDADLDSKIEGSSFRVRSEEYEKFKVYQTYETSLSVSDGDGAHCDFLDWKHFKSPRQQLHSSSLNFTIRKYSEKEACKFPYVSMDEVRKLVKTNCPDKFWYALENSKSVLDSPCSVGISSYIIQVEAISKKTNLKKTWIIRILSPMGC